MKESRIKFIAKAATVAFIPMSAITGCGHVQGAKDKQVQSYQQLSTKYTKGTSQALREFRP